MRVLFRLGLVLILVASGVSLGAARGQLRVAGAVVLCAGQAVVVQLIDQSGKPVSVTHICPDMALSLMVAVANPAPDAPIRGGARRDLVGNAAPVAPVIYRPVTAQARGPPVVV